MGPELEAAGHIKGKGERRRHLATHVLQLLFLGFGGFRFPIAHYPCTQASATELHVIVWSAVEMLSSYEFPILYISMDGAISNRQMMNIQFPASSSPSSQSFLAPNRIPNQHPLAFIMDYSHVMKKIQNSLLNSVDSCITGFCAMLQVRARLSPGSSVVPARLNSDAIENTFCQQRGEH